MEIAKSLKLLLITSVLLLVGAISWLIFNYQAHYGLSTDLLIHVDKILPMVNHEYFIPHPLFHYIVYFINRVSFFVGLDWSLLDISVSFLSLLVILIIYIIYKLSIKLVGDKYSWHSLLMISISLLFVMPLYLSFFSKNLYAGQWGPNTWHSPTVFIIKPFTLICLFFIVNISNGKDWYNKNIIIVLFALFTAISAFAKPSFVLSFIPATGIYLLIYYWKNFKLYFKVFLVFLPTVVVLVYQYTAAYDHEMTTTSYTFSDQIIFTFFGVLKLHSKNVILSIFLAIAFPLFLLLLDFKNCVKNQYLILCWLNVFISFCFAAFLAEKIKFEAANFVFVYILALFLLFVFSMFHFLKFIKDKQIVKWKQAKIAIIFIAYFLHFYSGIFYFFRYLLTQNFM